MGEAKVQQALLEHWRHEMEAAATYRQFAEQEIDPRRRDILLKLVSAEEEHAAKWAARIARWAARSRTHRV